VTLSASWDSRLTEAQVASLLAEFPLAQHGNVIEQRAFRKLSTMNFTSTNTLLAESSCPDEINADDKKNDIVYRFIERWGEVFSLGGLAGIPFTGKGGWGAFSGHVPDDGNIVVLYAPHVGIDDEGKFGSY